MYKGYNVREIVVFHQTVVIIDTPCGCSECQGAGKIQPGHRLCGLLPECLQNDKNIYPRLERGEWYAQFVGDPELVDEWLEGIE